MWLELQETVGHGTYIGAILVDNDNKLLPGNLTRFECQTSCLKEKQCKSANFRVTDHTLKGRCALSRSDRHLLPSSYRVSGYDEEYFENSVTLIICRLLFLRAI
nr:unnamed protein product [Callosobruchus chinensis]